MFVRWGNTISTHFTVANGVKQGGVISSILFNIYMDKLSIALNSSGIGRYLGNVFLNHLCYADDLCLNNLSSTGMQQLELINRIMLWTSNYCTIDQSHIPYALKVNPLKSLNHHFILIC